MSAYTKSGSASRAVALDLMLRTFMNSVEFNPSNGKIWENISRLVPGTTPQQCAQRWEELLSDNSVVAGDWSGLTATGRPISSCRTKRQPKRKEIRDQPIPATSSEIRISTEPLEDAPRPHSVMSGRVESGRGNRSKEGGVKRSISGEDRVWNRISQKQEEQAKQVLSYRSDLMKTASSRPPEDASRGTFAASFCQNFLSKQPNNNPLQQRDVSSNGADGTDPTLLQRGSIDGNTQQLVEEKSKVIPLSDSAQTVTSSTSTASSNPNMIIHVSDDNKKMERDFICPRDILVREMCYFAEHLSSETPQPWDEIDISVHCDIPVFEWLMQYAKQGLMAGPCGDALMEPLPAPTLEVNNTVSILISSDFLMMEKLVEECLTYCHDHLSAILASPCNMACINDKLVTRLAAKFTPLEVEEIVDKKDKLKSKLFLYQLDQLFNPVAQQLSASAATLYMCRYCKRLLTRKQESKLPCNTSRMSIDARGKIIYSHEMSSSWNINSHVQLLQQTLGLGPRGIFWRIWSRVNDLQCSKCHSHFQCFEFMRCCYHPGALLDKGRPVYACCSQPAAQFSVLPVSQGGCCFREHTVSTFDSALSKQVHAILKQLPDTITIVNSSHHNNNNNNKSKGTSTNTLKQSTHIKEVGSGSGVLKAVTSGVLKDNTLLSLLRTEHSKSCYSTCSASSSPSTSTQDSTSHTSTLQSDSSTDATPISTTTSSASSTGCSDTRQRSRDLLVGESDMEEDEEEEEEEVGGGAGRTASSRQQQAAAAASRTKQRAGKGGTKQPRQWRQDSRGPTHAGEWIWNSKKSRRWNQDMQRESDERRQQQLRTRLSQMSTTANKAKEVTFAGGIFSRLESQFRAQQAAAAIQTTQSSRFHGPLRKRY